MKPIPAGMFKTNCCPVMDELKAKGETTVLLTRHGERVGKLVPFNSNKGEIFGFFSGKGSITRNVVQLRH